MKREKRTISIFISDERIGFFVPKNQFFEESMDGYIDLEKNTISNGRLLEPELFYKKLQLLFRLNKIKPKKINFLISDHIILNREVTIKKELLEKSSLDQYIHKTINTDIHTPFEHPAYSYHIVSEDAATYQVMMLIANGDILHDYHDVFDRLGVRSVTFDVPSLAYYNAYLSKTKEPVDVVMLVAFYDRQISIKIIENNIPVFSIIEDADDSALEYFDVAESYIERIANYYKFNMRKGRSEIKKVATFNFSEELTLKMFMDKLFSKLTTFQIEVIDLLSKGDSLKAMPKMCQAAYLASLEKDLRIEMYQNLNFHLERQPKINQFLHVLLSLAFVITAGTLVVYLPYQAMRIDINTQLSINNNLENQLDVILREAPESRQYTQIEKDYSNAYDYLLEQEQFYGSYLEDLITLKTANMDIIGYSIDAEEKEIAIVIYSESAVEMDEYILMIYETHGIISGQTDPERWMDGSPTVNTLSPVAREVVIRYA